MKLFSSHNNDIDLTEFSEEEQIIINRYNELITNYKNNYKIEFHVVMAISLDDVDQLKDNTVIMDLLRNNEFLNSLMFPSYSFDMSRVVNQEVDANIHKVEEIL